MQPWTDQWPRNFYHSTTNERALLIWLVVEWGIASAVGIWRIRPRQHHCKSRIWGTLEDHTYLYLLYNQIFFIIKTCIDFHHFLDQGKCHFYLIVPNIRVLYPLIYIKTKFRFECNYGNRRFQKIHAWNDLGCPILHIESFIFLVF